MLKHYLLVTLTLLLLLPSSASYADDEQERRVRSGLKIFRSLLTADMDIVNKQSNKQTLNIAFIYSDDAVRAAGYARTFVRMGRREQKGKVKDRPLSVHLIKNLAAIAEHNLQPAAIFVIENISDEKIAATIEYGKQHGLVTYSPYTGHVEKGILSGLAIETRVRPYINLVTLNESKLRIKSFFLKAAKHYDP